MVRFGYLPKRRLVLEVGDRCMSNTGYPGVKGSPTDPGPREPSVPVQVIKEGPIHTLVRHQNGDVELVDNDRVKKK